MFACAWGIGSAICLSTPALAIGRARPGTNQMLLILAYESTPAKPIASAAMAFSPVAKLGPASRG